MAGDQYGQKRIVPHLPPETGLSSVSTDAGSCFLWSIINLASSTRGHIENERPNNIIKHGIFNSEM